MAEPSASLTPSNPPTQNDWEMLSMSISASTYGAPGSAPIICICDFCTGKASSPPASCLAASLSVPDLPPSLAPEGADESVTDAFTSDSFPPPSSRERDEASLEVAGGSQPDPFTDGWKPLRGNSAADLILDLAPATLRQYPAVPATVCGDDYKKGESSIDKAAYDTAPVIDEGSAGSPSKWSSVEGERMKKKPTKDCGSWLWKANARDARTLWSIALAASIVGIVVLGYRWHRERCLNQQLQLQLSAHDEKIGDLHHQVNRLKDIITGRRKVHVTRTSY